MRILLYAPGESSKSWIESLQMLLPDAVVVSWQESDKLLADYLIVRNPPAEVLAARPGLKAIFYIGAGIDGLLRLRLKYECPALLGAPVVRLDDAGMAEQMVDYVMHAVLHFYRRCHHYEVQQSKGIWKPLTILPKAQFPIGVMGAGVLGEQVAIRLCDFGFPVRTWSRNPKQNPRFQSFAGSELLMRFARQLRVLVNLLPLTSATTGILNSHLFQELADGAYLINVARGAHLVEADLVSAIREGKIDAARLDVFALEPLPPDHIFWSESKIYLTPHISADINQAESVKQIVAKIVSIENQEPINGVVNWDHEY